MAMNTGLAWSTARMPGRLVSTSVFYRAVPLATVISDRPEADDALVREEKIVDRGETITVSLRKGGGYVMRLRSID